MCVNIENAEQITKCMTTSADFLFLLHKIHMVNISLKWLSSFRNDSNAATGQVSDGAMAKKCDPEQGIVAN